MVISPVKWQYMELLQQMFLDNFARPLFEWCSANDMRLTGHVLHEDSLLAQAVMQGSLMRFYECMHDPGVDVLTEGNRHFPVVKQLASAARQLGQKWLLSELYGCTGWQMNFESHKRVGDWQERAEILKVNQSVRRALDLPLRGGGMVQPWFSRKNEPPPPALALVTLAFEFDVDAVPNGPVFLCVERPEHWQVRLNDHLLPYEAQGWWVDSAFQKIALPPGALAAGGNVLTLTGDFHQGINLEALYLIGGFGVRVDGPRAALTRLPDRLTVGDLTTQGLPFYGGTVTYWVPVPDPSSSLFLAVPAFEAACVKVTSPQAPATVIAWPPYRAEVLPEAIQNGRIALQVVLTRRNTFGPLHQVPLRPWAYHPGSFVSERESFSEAYMLYPAGLLQAPVWSHGV